MRIGILAAVALTCALEAAALAAPRLIDGVAATVNEEMIMLSEVRERASFEIARLESEGLATAEKREAALKHALEDLIADKLLVAEEAKNNVEVTDQEVEFAIEDVRRQNNMDAETFARALASQGTSIESYREKMRRDLGAMKLIGQKVRSKVKVSDEDVKAEYSRRSRLDQEDVEIHAQHIVIQVPKDADAAAEEKARARAAELSKRARSGEDFTELAKKYSEGASKAEGGDVGFFKRGEMVGPFEKAAFSMEDGAISDPVRSPFGWHVIKVIERRAGTVKPFEEVRDELRERLVREQMQRQTEQYVAELRKQATVDIKMADLR